MPNSEEQRQDLELQSVTSMDTNDEPGASSSTTISSKSHPPAPATATSNTKGKENALSAMASRITIAGIEDAYKAKTKLERYTYAVVILFGAFAMVYSSVFIAIRYSIQDPIEIHRAEISEEAAPFPNVSVCLPQMKNPRIRELLVFPPEVRRQMEKHKIPVEEILEFMEFSNSAFYGQKEHEGSAKSAIGVKILDASMAANTLVIHEIMKTSCENSFIDCTFGSIRFECCSVGVYMMLDHGSCWHFDINTIERELQSDERNQQASNALSIDVLIDKRLVIPDDNVLPDGVIVHIDQIPSMFSTPEVIPFGADAHIILSEPVHLRQITQCQSNNNLPNLTRLDYYDPNAIFCIQDRNLDLLAKEVGCDPGPFLTFVPSNETRCGAGMMLATLQLIGGEVPTDARLGVKDLDKRAHEIQLDSYSSCRPLCDRWSYSVYSSSYGYIQYHEDVQERYENISMTRLRVYFQDSAYQRRIEEYSNLSYLAFCEIGGVWGVYLGLSIVSILQTIAYAFVLWRKRKELRVRPASPTEGINDAAGGAHSQSEGHPKGRKQAWI